MKRMILLAGILGMAFLGCSTGSKTTANSQVRNVASDLGTRETWAPANEKFATLLERQTKYEITRTDEVKKDESEFSDVLRRFNNLDRTEDLLKKENMMSENFRFAFENERKTLEAKASRLSAKVTQFKNLPVLLNKQHFGEVLEMVNGLCPKAELKLLEDGISFKDKNGQVAKISVKWDLVRENQGKNFSQIGYMSYYASETGAPIFERYEEDNKTQPLIVRAGDSYWSANDWYGTFFASFDRFSGTPRVVLLQASRRSPPNTFFENIRDIWSRRDNFTDHASVECISKSVLIEQKGR